MTDRPLLTPAEVAEHVGLSVKAVRRAIERGELPAAKLCGRIRIRPDAVDNWIDRGVINVRPSTRGAPSSAVTAAVAANGLRQLLREGHSER